MDPTKGGERKEKNGKNGSEKVSNADGKDEDRSKKSGPKKAGKKEDLVEEDEGTDIDVESSGDDCDNTLLAHLEWIGAQDFRSNEEKEADLLVERFYVSPSDRTPHEIAKSLPDFSLESMLLLVRARSEIKISLPPSSAIDQNRVILSLPCDSSKLPRG